MLEESHIHNKNGEGTQQELKIMYQFNISNSNDVKIGDFIRLTKPKILLLLALTGAVAFYVPQVGSYSFMDLIIYVVLGCLSAGGAMAINNAIDYDIDQKMERTLSRASTGKLSRGTVTAFGTTLMTTGIVVSYFYFGIYTALFLSWGALFYIFAYSLYLKRKSWMNTILGGLASPAPVWGGYAARFELASVTNQFFLGIPMEGWLLGFLVFIWTPSHTWAMAVKNYHDYQRAEIPMLPVVLGIQKTAYINLVAGFITICFGIYVVSILHAKILPIVFGFSLVFLTSLITFVQNPTVKEGTKNFHMHNIWLALVFLVLLL